MAKELKELGLDTEDLHEYARLNEEIADIRTKLKAKETARTAIAERIVKKLSVPIIDIPAFKNFEGSAEKDGHIVLYKTGVWGMDSYNYSYDAIVDMILT